MASFKKTIEDREFAEVAVSYDNQVSLYLQPDYGQGYYEVITPKQARQIGKALLDVAHEAKVGKKAVKKAAKKEGK